MAHFNECAHLIEGVDKANRAYAENIMHNIDPLQVMLDMQRHLQIRLANDKPETNRHPDSLETAGIPCFGPNAKAAAIEGSKVFSKNLMRKYGIPTAEYRVFEDMQSALEYVETAPVPTVIKADGLAL